MSNLPGIWLTCIFLYMYYISVHCMYIPLCCCKSCLRSIFAESLCRLFKWMQRQLLLRIHCLREKYMWVDFAQCSFSLIFNCDQWLSSVPLSTLTKLFITIEHITVFLEIEIWGNPKQSRSREADKKAYCENGVALTIRIWYQLNYTNCTKNI